MNQNSHKRTRPSTAYTCRTHFPPSAPRPPRTTLASLFGAYAHFVTARYLHNNIYKYIYLCVQKRVPAAIAYKLQLAPTSN